MSKNLTENTEQRKTITGASAAYRYAHIAGLCNFIIFLVIIFFIDLTKGVTWFACLSSCPSPITRMNLLFSVLPMYIVFFLIALSVVALGIRERHNFRWNRWALLEGSIYFLLWILVPAYFLWDMDESLYHSVIVGTYALFIALYYSVGYFAFRGKTGAASL